MTTEFNGKIALDIRQHLNENCIIEPRGSRADEGIEFIHIAITFNPGIVLPRLRAVKQPRIAAVAGLGVDFHRSALLDSSASSVSSGSQ